MSINRKPSLLRPQPSRRFARHPLAVCLALALMAPAPFALAAPAVSNCNDSGAGSLREAVSGADTGDVIDLSGLACHTIQLGSAIATKAGINDLSIGAGAKQAFAIAGNDSSRLFQHNGTGRLTLSHLSLSHGKSADVGGCIASAADLTLDDVSISTCAAGSATATGARGGAVAVIGNATLIGTRITNSRADGTGRVFGGGLFVGNNLDATDSVFSGNVAQSHIATGGSQFDNIVQGGGLHANGSITLHAATISGNTALSDSYEVFGGGVSAGSREQGAASSTIEMVDSSVTGNRNESHCDVCAPQGGGGIVTGNALITHTVISDNVVTSTNHYGGGGGFRFFGDGATATISDSTISGNHADSAGGGVIGPGGGTLSVTRTQIRDNVGENTAGLGEAGGGILGFGVTVNLVDSAITGNTSGSGGGGINLLFGEYAPAPSTIVNSTISGNAAVEGGGIKADGGELRVSNSTIAFNSATDRGAGISGTDYTYVIRLQSSIISNNSRGGATSNVWAFPDVVSGANNLIPTGGGSPADMPGDTLTADPLLLPLASNGGPTLTHALGGGSPALNAGNNALVLAGDQRGGIWGRVSGGQADIGAYEAQPTLDAIFADNFED